MAEYQLTKEIMKRVKPKKNQIGVEYPSILDNLQLKCRNSKGRTWTVKVTDLFKHLWLTEPNDNQSE